MPRYVVQSKLLPEEAGEALKAALGPDIALYGDTDVHRQVLRLADQLGIRATCDAHCLALTKRLGGEFWTTDQRLVRSVPPALPWVRMVGE